MGLMCTSTWLIGSRQSVSRMQLQWIEVLGKTCNELNWGNRTSSHMACPCSRGLRSRFHRSQQPGPYHKPLVWATAREAATQGRKTMLARSVTSPLSFATAVAWAKLALQSYLKLTRALVSLEKLTCTRDSCQDKAVCTRNSCQDKAVSSKASLRGVTHYSHRQRWFTHTLSWLT